MTPRQQARAAGEKFYEGRPCRRCGGTQRYAANKKCVPCWRAYLRQYQRRVLEGRESAGMTPRHQAWAAGEKFYEGRPCRRCGGTQRYVSTARCVTCWRARSLQYWRRRPQEERDRLSAEWKAERTRFARDCRKMELFVATAGLDAYLTKLDQDRTKAYNRHVRDLMAAKRRLDRATKKLVIGGRGEARCRAEYENEAERLDREAAREYTRISALERRAREYAAQGRGDVKDGC